MCQLNQNFLVEKLLHKKFVTQVFPLHEPENLKRLGHGLLSKNPALLTKRIPAGNILKKRFIIHILMRCRIFMDFDIR